MTTTRTLELSVSPERSKYIKMAVSYRIASTYKIYMNTKTGIITFSRSPDDHLTYEIMIHTIKRLVIE